MPKLTIRGRPVEFPAPGKVIRREVATDDDGSTRLIVQYDDGTMLTSVMHPDGNVSLDCNREFVVDEIDGKAVVRLVKN